MVFFEQNLPALLLDQWAGTSFRSNLLKSDRFMCNRSLVFLMQLWLEPKDVITSFVLVHLWLSCVRSELLPNKSSHSKNQRSREESESDLAASQN
jgi:hypothetical protein